LIKPVGIDSDLKAKLDKSEKFHILFKTKYEKLRIEICYA